jgi:hypothetical protein
LVCGADETGGLLFGYAVVEARIPPRPAAGQRQPHSRTPKLRRRSVPVAHRTPPSSSVGALHSFRASPRTAPTNKMARGIRAMLTRGESYLGQVMIGT